MATKKIESTERHPEGKVLKRVGPAVRMIANGEPAWYLDFRYDDGKGARPRLRKKADVQTQSGAVAEGEARKAKALRCGNPYGPLEIDGPIIDVVDTTETPNAARPLRDLIPHYVDVWAPVKLAHSSMATAKYAIKAHILPAFGDMPIEKIDRSAVAQWDAVLAKKGLIPASRRRVQNIHRSILCRCAVDLGWLKEAPRMPSLPKTSDIVPDVLPDAQVNALLLAANAKQRLALLLASDAGLRPAEVRELRWGDVQAHTWQLQNGRTREGLVLRVRRGFAMGKVTMTKTGKERIVPVSDRLRDALGTFGASDELVSTNRSGTRWSEQGLGDLLHTVARRINLVGSWRYYDLRHYFCTSLFRSGVNPRVIMDLMGHADLQTTLRYAHVLQGDLIEGIQTMHAFRERERATLILPEAAPESGESPIEILAHSRPTDSDAA